MFGGQWLEELFQPQPMVSREGLQSLLQKVAHSSIMRLNSVAMEKVSVCVCACVYACLCLCGTNERHGCVFVHVQSSQRHNGMQCHCPWRLRYIQYTSKNIHRNRNVFFKIIPLLSSYRSFSHTHTRTALRPDINVVQVSTDGVPETRGHYSGNSEPLGLSQGSCG